MGAAPQAAAPGSTAESAAASAAWSAADPERPCVAVMQPTYLPWAGYFGLIAAADHFVVLDDVQLARRSWQTRNRVAGPQGRVTVLSVPVRATRGRDELRIHDAVVDDSQAWRDAHRKTLRHLYARAPHAGVALALVDAMLDCPSDRLSDLHVEFITATSRALGFDATFHLASARRDRARPKEAGLVELTQLVGGRTYLSARGSMGYLEDAGGVAVFAAAGIDLRYQDYEPVAYPQVQTRGHEFVPCMSIVDLVANAGLDGAATVVRAGNRGWTGAVPGEQS